MLLGHILEVDISDLNLVSSKGLVANCTLLSLNMILVVQLVGGALPLAAACKLLILSLKLTQILLDSIVARYF